MPEKTIKKETPVDSKKITPTNLKKVPPSVGSVPQKVVKKVPTVWDLTIKIDLDTSDLLNILKKELKEIYWLDLSYNDIILYLYTVYCKK